MLFQGFCLNCRHSLYGPSQPAPAALLPTFLCLCCQQQLRPATTNFSQGQALYQYNTLLRTLVHRAKIAGDVRALACLVHLFCEHPLVQSELSFGASGAGGGALGIVAVPASLWGRLRGRFDIPWFVTQRLSELGAVPKLRLPQALYWRVRKRALTPAQRRQALALNFPEREGKMRALLIDDIITSGFTLEQVVRALPDKTCRFLVLAEAARARRNQEIF